VGNYRIKNLTSESNLQFKRQKKRLRLLIEEKTKKGSIAKSTAKEDKHGVIKKRNNTKNIGAAGEKNRRSSDHFGV